MTNVSIPLEHSAATPRALCPKRYRLGIALLTLFFAGRAFFFAFFVTPLWDVPDETGHYAYVADLAEGRGIPVGGKSQIPPNIMRHWKGKSASPEPNWISQHPPLYHLLAVPALAAGKTVSGDENIHFRAPRITSVIFGAATIPLLFVVIVEATAVVELAFAMCLSVAFLPMFSHMSSGTNHDVAMAFVGTLAALYFVRIINRGSTVDLYRLAVVLAIGGAIKLSIIAVTLPLMIVAIFLLHRRGELSPGRSAAACLIAISTVALWLIRNKIVAGSTLLLSKPAIREEGVLEFFTSRPVIEHTVKNFLALIGWTGSGEGELRWLQIGHASYVPYFVLIAAFVVAATCWNIAKVREQPHRLAGVAILMFWGVIFAALFAAISLNGGSAFPEGGVYAALVALLAFAPLLALSRDRSVELVASSLAVLLVFVIAFAVRIWNAFLFYGEMRATHGRYFFVVLPFLVLALAFPAYELIAARSEFRARVAMWATAAVVILADLHFTIRDVLPFYGRALH